MDKFTHNSGVCDVYDGPGLTSGAADMFDLVMDDSDVFGRVGRHAVRRVRLPALAIDSFTVIGPDLRSVDLIDEYLAWLTDCERSPNTWIATPSL
jgi:hypothetical protein